MPAYPATLPAPVYDGYGLEPFDPVARSSIGTGRRAARERFATAPARVAVSWVFSEAEFAVFEAWFSRVALDGAAWFDIALADGKGMTTVSACFAAVWRFRATSGGYAVTATLAVRRFPLAA